MSIIRVESEINNPEMRRLDIAGIAAIMFYIDSFFNGI